MELDKFQIEKLVEKYPLGKCISFERIKEQGFMNHMFIVNTDKGKFILRIAKNTKKKKDLLFEINLLNSLKGLPVPKYVKDRKGQYLNRFRGHYYSVYRYLEGKMPEKMTENLLKEIAFFLARFHNQTEGFNLNQQRFAWYTFTNERADEFERFMVKRLADYRKEIHYLKLEVLKNMLPENIPKGPLHVDVRRENVLAIGDTLTGVVDFDNCQIGPYSLDLAMSIIWLCTEKGGLNYKKMYAFLQHYEKIRKLNKTERQNLFRAIKYAYASQVFVNHYVYAQGLVTEEHFHFGRNHFLAALRKLDYEKFLIQRYIELYRQGRCSIDKAAKEVGITVAEMMQEAANAGIKSTETIEEYKAGLKLLS